MDGLRDLSENMVEGVTVELLDQNQNVISTSVTDDNGLYYFDGIEDGDYYIRVVGDENDLTIPNAGDDRLDSDFPNSGVLGVSIRDGETVSVDAGIYESSLATVGSNLLLILLGSALSMLTAVVFYIRLSLKRQTRIRL